MNLNVKSRGPDSEYSYELQVFMQTFEKAFVWAINKNYDRCPSA